MENLKKFEEFDWKFGLGKKKEPVTADFEEVPHPMGGKDAPEKKPYVYEDDAMVRRIIKKIDLEFNIENLKEEKDVYYDEDSGSGPGSVYYLDGDRIYSDGYNVFIGDNADNSESLDVSMEVAEELENLLRNKKCEVSLAERNRIRQQYRAKYASNENRRYKKK